MSIQHSSTGYHPVAEKINASQAHLVAIRFSGQSLAIKHFTNTRRIANLSEQIAMLSAIDRLYHAVPRGRGYCLNRASLANLRGYVIGYSLKTQMKTQKECHNV